MIYPDAGRGGKREKGASNLKLPDFSKMHVSRARAVLRYSPPRERMMERVSETRAASISVLRSRVFVDYIAAPSRLRPPGTIQKPIL
jgi:hypothetical protein